MCACDPGYAGDGLNCTGTDIIILCGYNYFIQGIYIYIYIFVEQNLQNENYL